MELGSTFPWYASPAIPISFSLSLFLSLSLSPSSFSSCIECKGDFPLPVGQPPLSPIDLHLQLFLRESAYLSLSSLGLSFFLGDELAPTCVVSSGPRFYFLFRPKGTLTHVSTKDRPRLPRYKVRDALYYHVRRK